MSKQMIFIGDEFLNSQDKKVKIVGTYTQYSEVIYKYEYINPSNDTKGRTFSIKEPSIARCWTKVKTDEKPKTIQNKINQKENNMTKTLKETTQELIQDNKDALTTATELKAGQIINTQVVKLASKKLPIYLRGYAEHPAAKIVLANAIGLGLKHYAPENRKLQKISKLMLNAAAFDTINSFNIDELIDDLLSGLKLPEGIDLNDGK